MLTHFICFILGAFIGMLLICLAVVAGRED